MAGNLETPIELKLDNNAVMEKWAEYTIEQFHLAIQRTKIGLEVRVINGRTYKGIRAGELWNSFEKELIKANGNVDRVILKFNQYGRMLDMGAGRGYTHGEQVLNKQFDVYRGVDGKLKGRHPRKVKKWYSKTYAHQVHRLSEIYQEDYGKQLVRGLESSLSGNINLTA